MNCREAESPKESEREDKAGARGTAESSGDSGSETETDSSEDEDEDGRWTPEDSEARKAARKVRGNGGGAMNQVCSLNHVILSLRNMGAILLRSSTQK